MRSRAARTVRTLGDNHHYVDVIRSQCAPELLEHCTQDLCGHLVPIACRRSDTPPFHEPLRRSEQPLSPQEHTRVAQEGDRGRGTGEPGHQGLADVCSARRLEPPDRAVQNHPTLVVERSGTPMPQCTPLQAGTLWAQVTTALRISSVPPAGDVPAPPAGATPVPPAGATSGPGSCCADCPLAGHLQPGRPRAGDVRATNLRHGTEPPSRFRRADRRPGPDQLVSPDQ